MDQNSAVILTDVTKVFGETRALAGVSLHLLPGEVHAIVGENGSGKSTLAKIISGVQHPTSGAISAFGQAINGPRDARSAGIATVFQEILVAEQLSVLDNMFAGTDTLFRRGFAKRQAEQICRDLMQRFVGAPVEPHVLVRDLPLNVRQWIVIGRALTSNPKLLILDESSAALDQDATARLHGEIRRLRDAGTCVAIVTHRIAELVRIADRATVLRDGEVCAVLERDQINERNLLDAMSPKSAQGRGPKRAARERTDELCATATELRLRPGKAPFDFRIGRGEIVGVTGLDGQGQAAFVRALSGVEPPAEGDVQVHHGGRAAVVRDHRGAVEQGIAFISGDRTREGIFPNLSIVENFGMPLYRRHLRGPGVIDFTAIQGQFRQQAGRLNIKLGNEADHITSLSGGNQQKVLIARALAAQPKLIVLDDPARGVDARTKSELYELLTQYAASGGSVVYLSTEIEEFFGLADRVVVFRDDTKFAELPASGLTEAVVLDAMFGHGQKEATPQ